MDQSVSLVLTLFLRKTGQESINLERKSYLDCSLNTLCTRGGIWMGDIMVADIEELETMDASENLLQKTQCKGSNFPNKMENLFFQTQMDESNFLEEVRN